MKTALITGIAGQDGSYLAEFLLGKGYKVVGLRRKTSDVQADNLRHMQGEIELVYGDLLDSFSLTDVIQKCQPDEIYNLASQSYPGESWRLSIETGEITGLGAHRLFEVVRRMKPDSVVYQASSSEMFGDVKESPQSENTPFRPMNPYAAAKVYAHNIAKIYVKTYGMFIANGILFNHESPRRGMHFLSQKVTYGAACIHLGLVDSPARNERNEPIVKNGKVALGNLDVSRDWGFAGDYVEAMWLMLQQEDPNDFVIGTGQIRSVKDLCSEAFGYVGLDWHDHVYVDPQLTRPVETGPTVADPAKAEKILGWKARTAFSDLVAMMVESHLKNLRSALGIT
jgi:GDPmannose 4,6-dehydratase